MQWVKCTLALNQLLVPVKAAELIQLDPPAEPRSETVLEIPHPEPVAQGGDGEDHMVDASARPELESGGSDPADNSIV